MRAKVVVTDACIFIDLFNLGLTESFFGLDIEVHTTSSVINELYVEQQQILKIYKSVNKIIIHNLTEHDFHEIFSAGYPKSLSETDKSVLHIANRINSCVLSSDKSVRNCAKNKKIEYHGILWIFDNLINSGILSKKEGVFKLNELLATNLFFRNNHQLSSEINKRLEIWK